MPAIAYEGYTEPEKVFSSLKKAIKYCDSKYERSVNFDANNIDAMEWGTYSYYWHVVPMEVE
jgi:hypothetical protein